MLEFERDFMDLENKVKELETLTTRNHVDVHSEIEKCYGKIQEVKEDVYKSLSPWEKVGIARLADRPTAKAFIEYMVTDFIELHGDRQFSDDPSIIGGIGMIHDLPVTIIGQQKGTNTKENIQRNFGMPHPEGYRKALRLMKQAEKFGRPIICLIDTPGAFCGVEAEQRGQGEAIARNLMEMSGLEVPIISIVIGEGGSGGALAIGVADEVWMLENSVYSILSPEGFATILWKDANRAKEAAEVMKLTAEDLKGYGIVDQVIKEPLGGLHKNPQIVMTTLQEKIYNTCLCLLNLSKEELKIRRYNRLRHV